MEEALTGQAKKSATFDDRGYIPVEFPPVGQTTPFDRRWWRWDVRTGKRLSSIRYVASRAIRIAWSRSLWGPLARGIVQECCSLPRRIGTIYATKVCRHGVCYGPVGPERSQREETLACIRDTQHITNCYRWATLLDVKLIVQAWRMGAEWASVYRDIPQLCSRCKATESLELNPPGALPGRGNSMPPQEVQQPRVDAERMHCASITKSARRHEANR
jgi:hypothetical protein